MPVLSESTSVPSIYLFLGCAIAILFIFLRRKRTSRALKMSNSSTSTNSEKLPETTEQSHQPSPRGPGSRIQHQPQPPPPAFPRSSSTNSSFGSTQPRNQSTISSITSFSSQNQDFSQNTSFTSSPTTYTHPPQFPKPTSKSYDSSFMPPDSEIPFTPQTSNTSSFYQNQDPTSYTYIIEGVEVELPRRRSYTKTMSQGTEIEGQVEYGYATSLILIPGLLHVSGVLKH
jgi:hypothetical protein